MRIDLQTEDPELAAFFEGVVGVVEATNFEKHALWREWCEFRDEKTWEDNLLGHGRIVGMVGNMPVHISLLTTRVEGHKILFYYATSQVVDHRMVEKWLRERLPDSAFIPEYAGVQMIGSHLNHADAMNFVNVIPRKVNIA